VSGLPHVPSAEAQAELTINLDALVQNWRLLSERIAPAECAAVVKADAYGLGAEQATRALVAAGCRTFFVAQASEGARVRAAAGADAVIYVLNGVLAGEGRLAAYAAHDLRPVLGSQSDLVLWSQGGLAARLPAALHVDTGMNRLGIAPADALALATSSAVQLDLVMSHFASSEIADDLQTARQIALFESVRAAFPKARASMANSSALFLREKPFYDLARPGYALYGGNPTPGSANPMRAVVTLRAPVIQTRNIGVGETVGYNAQWRASRPTRLAVIGIGYADGLLRSLMATNLNPAQMRAGGEALIEGTRCPFAGRVSMDLTTIDVTDVPAPVVPGTMVELLGETISVDDMAARAGTIGYEVLTNLGRRYHRVYRGG
jgi:alanine racemase